jgi:membrane protein implicated in regulation of membrane protease activity
MERKIFWIVFTVLGLAADLLLPIWWGLAATIPCLVIAWWVAYRSDWF